MLWSQRAHANTQERQTFPRTFSKWKEPKWWMHSILILLFCYYKSPNPSDITCHTATELTGNLEMYPVFCHPAPPQVMRLHAYCFLYLRKLILFCSALLCSCFFFIWSNCGLIVWALGMICLWTLRYLVLVKALRTLVAFGSLVHCLLHPNENIQKAGKASLRPPWL